MRIYTLTSAALMLLGVGLVSPILPFGGDGDATGVVSRAPQIAPQAVVRAADSDALLAAINVQRESIGLHPLTWDPALADAAESHVRDMESRAYFGHETPEGADVEDRVEVAYPLMRQTLWQGWSGAHAGPERVAERVVDDWSMSVSQLSALLDPEITHAGGAILRRGEDGHAVMVFGGDLSLQAPS